MLLSAYGNNLFCYKLLEIAFLEDEKSTTLSVRLSGIFFPVEIQITKELRGRPCRS